MYDGVNFVQELTIGGTPTANLLTGLGIDEVFTRVDTSGTRISLVDGLGSTLELADTAGALQTHYTFEPYGATTVSGTVSTNATQFTGRENDGTGLFYYRARFLNPVLGRFISEDPVGFGGGVNFYSYVGNAPSNATDPSGLFRCGIHQDLAARAAAAVQLNADLTRELVKHVCDPDNTKDANSSDPEATHRHGMGGRKDNGRYESCQQAYQGAEDVLRRLMKSNQWSDVANALHLLQDQWAAGHRSQPWGGWFTWPEGTSAAAHAQGDVNPTAGAWNGALDATSRYLKDYMNNKVGEPGDYLRNFCK